MKLLPILPYVVDYPFLRPARFLVGEIERGSIFDYAVKRAEEILESLLKNGHYHFTPENKPFYCLACDKPCKNLCDANALGEKIRWDRCNLCGICHSECRYQIGSDTYRELEVMAKVSVYSYVMMMSAISNASDAVRRRFATSLARSYRRAMEIDRSEILPELLSANFNIKMRREGNLWVHVTDYLRASSRIKTQEWKLFLRNLSKGYVELSLREFYRIVEERMRDSFFEKFPLRIDGIEPLEKIVREYEASKKTRRIEGVKRFDAFPPCMKKIVEDLRDGLNVPHTARFALTAYMLTIGFSVEEVLSLFRSAPDFDEEKARYQIEHIAGQRGARKEYEVPSCSTMKTYQNCVAECKVSHPLEYYRRRIYEGGGREAKGKTGGDKAHS